jgi:hypothetical protein
MVVPFVRLVPARFTRISACQFVKLVADNPGKNVRNRLAASEVKRLVGGRLIGQAKQPADRLFASTGAHALELELNVVNGPGHFASPTAIRT